MDWMPLWDSFVNVDLWVPLAFLMMQMLWRQNTMILFIIHSKWIQKVQVTYSNSHALEPCGVDEGFDLKKKR